jgi:ATP-binding cassette subfamily F protein 3
VSITLRSVAKSFGDVLVFSDVTFDLHPGEKIALVGRNGSGKSTLLKLIAGLDEPTHGTVTVQGTVGLLEQQVGQPDRTVMDAVTPPALDTARRALRAAQALLIDPTSEHLERYANAEDAFRTAGGYDFDLRVSTVLGGLDLPRDRLIRELSGGQQRRVMLAALLLTPAEVLLLDEPSNHLDARSVEWLEQWVKDAPAAVLIASHDRAFLDATVTRVLELERGELHAYPGNYTSAMLVKAQHLAAQHRQYETYTRKREALSEEMHVRQSKARSAGAYNPRRARDNDKLLSKGKAQNAQVVNASRAKAMERRLAQMDVVDKPFDDRTVVDIPLPEVPHGPADVIRADDLILARGGRVLVQHLNFTLRRGEKVALTGPNGSGKSSVIEAALGRLAPAGGRITLGPGLNVYWAGQHAEELRAFGSLGEALRDAQPALRTQDVYHLLAQLGLPARPETPIDALSGGERTRLTLARLAVTRASLLVLDEPTNHLDVRAIEALETLLVQYRGAVLFSSHDRRLVARVATRVVSLGPG